MPRSRANLGRVKVLYLPSAAGGSRSMSAAVIPRHLPPLMQTIGGFAIESSSAFATGGGRNPTLRVRTRPSVAGPKLALRHP
jgi:hypothetical protein